MNTENNSSNTSPKDIYELIPLVSEYSQAFEYIELLSSRANSQTNANPPTYGVDRIDTASDIGNAYELTFCVKTSDGKELADMLVQHVPCDKIKLPETHEFDWKYVVWTSPGNTSHTQYS